jgi:hypothetical protein
MANLGKLKKIELREGWNHEALDFTNWLAREENLAMLSEELGIDNITVLQTEANAGDFKIDILAEEEQTGHKIIIENQLEKTNHDHLGKILTYASSQDAKYIIWIAKEIRDEHKQAIDWLNEHTDDDLNFFAIQIELWQIGNSEPAPKFNIISKPNDWAKVVKNSASQPNITDTKLVQLDFWNKFKDYADKNSKKLRLRKTDPQHWYSLSMGSSEAHISLTINTQTNIIGCELYIPHDKELFAELEEKKVVIEKEIGHKLEWMGLEGKKASRIKLSKGTDIKWEKGNEIKTEYLEWLMKQAEKFQDVFGKYIKEATK